LSDLSDGSDLSDRRGEREEKMKRTFALIALAACAAFAGCKSAPSGDEAVIEDRVAAQKAIDEADRLFDSGKFYKAHQQYDMGLRLYARHPRREEIVKREIEDIGLKFLDGTIKTGWFGTNLFRSRHPELGVEIIRKVVLKNFKQGYAFLPDAQYKLATHLFNSQRYEEAQLEFEFLIKNFKDSYWTTISEFLLAESLYRQNQGARFDQKTLVDAQAHFNAFLERSQTGVEGADDAHVAEARERLETIRNTMAQNQYLIGEFYYGQRKYRAAAEALRIVPAQYPGTVWADRADQLLAKVQQKIDEER
jgi:outer membrane protein assembly factor BamD (BamD/ComL family)